MFAGDRNQLQTDEAAGTSRVYVPEWLQSPPQPCQAAVCISSLLHWVHELLFSTQSPPLGWRQENDGWEQEKEAASSSRPLSPWLQTPMKRVSLDLSVCKDKVPGKTSDWPSQILFLETKHVGQEASHTGIPTTLACGGWREGERISPEGGWEILSKSNPCITL